MRRTCVLLFAALALSGENRAPTDPEKLNKFATAYNKYAAELRDGVVDVKQWDRVTSAWRAVAGN